MSGTESVIGDQEIQALIERHGSEEQTGFVLVTLPEYNSLRYASGLEAYATTVGSQRGADSIPPILAALITLFHGPKAEGTLRVMLSYAADNAIHENQTIESNARRIVACVNACEGINPEAIPKLVAALRDISTPRLGGSGGSPEGAELARCISVAADAIADASLSA